MKVALSEILWTAANRHLSKDSTWSEPKQVRSYSCDAVGLALSGGKCGSPGEMARHFLQELGCNTFSFCLFEDHRPGITRQGVRYMWLLLAAKVAEDENIMIEVAK